MNPTLSDADRDRLAAAADGTRPLTLPEKAHYAHLEDYYPAPDRAVIRAAMTSPGKPAAPTSGVAPPGAHGRTEAAKRYGARTR